ncbi:MAG TPA: guanylate kinase [Thermoleophilia bacterium]|nr:guanylate kinase [Thermoleophilia bacterium]
MRPCQVGAHHGAVPHQPEQDRRRSLGAPAARVARHLRGLTIPAVFVISGPSGAGKGTVIALVRQRLLHVVTSVSATTRAPRPGELDGREYHFMSEEAFRSAVADGDFLEWVEYSGNLYGTLRREVDRKVAAGDDVILEIELVGARAVREALPEAISVFIAPPSMAELAERLRGRGTETAVAIARRLHRAEAEVAAAKEFDHIVVNDDAARAADEVAAIIEAHRKED